MMKPKGVSAAAKTSLDLRNAVASTTVGFGVGAVRFSRSRTQGEQTSHQSLNLGKPYTRTVKRTTGIKAVLGERIRSDPADDLLTSLKKLRNQRDNGRRLIRLLRARVESLGQNNSSKADEVERRHKETDGLLESLSQQEAKTADALTRCAETEARLRHELQQTTQKHETEVVSLRNDIASKADEVERRRTETDGLLESLRQQEAKTADALTRCTETEARLRAELEQTGQRVAALEEELLLTAEADRDLRRSAKASRKNPGLANQAAVDVQVAGFEEPPERTFGAFMRKTVDIQVMLIDGLEKGELFPAVSHVMAQSSRKKSVAYGQSDFIKKGMNRVLRPGKDVETTCGVMPSSDSTVAAVVVQVGAPRNSVEFASRLISSCAGSRFYLFVSSEEFSGLQKEMPGVLPKPIDIKAFLEAASKSLVDKGLPGTKLAVAMVDSLVGSYKSLAWLDRDDRVKVIVKYAIAMLGRGLARAIADELGSTFKGNDVLPVVKKVTQMLKDSAAA